MITLEVLTSKTKFPKDVDYTFDKEEKFLKLVPYLSKKLSGTWEIILVEFSLASMESISQMLTDKGYINVKFYCTLEAYNSFILKHPKYRKAEKTRKEMFVDYINAQEKLFDPGALTELYKRCNGSLQVLESYMPDIILRAEEEQTVTLKVIKAIVPQQESIYASDVIRSILAQRNKFVPKNGHALSKYLYNTYNKPVILVTKLISTLGNDYAFYALRKNVYRLYENKLKYLKNIVTPDDYILQVVDVYTLLYLKISFELSKPSQLIALMHIIQCRAYGEDLFSPIILKEAASDADLF